MYAWNSWCPMVPDGRSIFGVLPSRYCYELGHSTDSILVAYQNAVRVCMCNSELVATNTSAYVVLESDSRGKIYWR